MTSAFKDFLKKDSAVGVLLMIATGLAMLFANSQLIVYYEYFLDTPIELRLGRHIHIAKPLLLWINDGLMAIFFLMIGLEVKRELLVGQLSSRAQIALPGIAAIGGMLVPAIVYVLINAGDNVALNGWAIPAATDIAFALGVLALAGKRVPSSLKIFLLALAIMDDLGAIVIIALFYSGDPATSSLILAAFCLLALVLLNRLKVMQITPYMWVGALLWIFVLKSGVHATLAGILVALTVPARARHGTRSFLHRSRRLIDEFEAIEASAGEASAPILAEPEKHAVVEQLQDTAAKATTPLQLWERAYEYPVALFVLPLFALVNAGIHVEINALPRLLGDPLAVGIILGLVLGKTAGIGLATGALLALGRGRLPKGMQPSHVVGVGLLGGMGFTMSIFITGLGFGDQPEQLLIAKTGILTASLIAGLGGLDRIQAERHRGLAADTAGLAGHPGGGGDLVVIQQDQVVTFLADITHELTGIFEVAACITGVFQV